MPFHDRSASYKNWDYLVVNATGTIKYQGLSLPVNIDSSELIKIGILGSDSRGMSHMSSNAHIVIGPKTKTYWRNCCGANGKSSCNVDKVTTVSYGGGCYVDPDSGGSAGKYMVLSFWNHNTIMSETFTMSFAPGWKNADTGKTLFSIGSPVGPGPN